MPNIYCPSCGQGIKYLYSKPERCTSCDHSFAVVKYDQLPDDEDDAAVKVTVTKRNKKMLPPKSLNVQIDSYQFEKLGEVMGSNPGETRQKRRHTTKEDLKSKIFKASPSSIDDVEV